MADSYCSLCGGPYRPIPHGHGAGLEHPHWATLARLVRGPQDPRSPEEPVLTGLGYMTSSKLVAPADHTASCKETSPNGGLADYDVQVRPGTDRPFAFHEVCWQMLLTKIGAEENKPDCKQVGTCLFHVLNSVPWAETGDLIPEHRYYGAIKLRQGAAWQDRPDLLLADPSQYLPLANDGPQTATSSHEFKEQSLIKQTTRQGDPFTKLPLEVIFDIFTLLPSKDACAARLSSRHLAVMGYMNNLPQGFWASRFSPEREMGFVFAELLPQNGADRWLHTYLDCKKTLKERGHQKTLTEGSHETTVTEMNHQNALERGHLAFLNRGRIWRCLEGFAITLDALITHHRKKQPSEVIDNTCFLGQKIRCPELPDRFGTEQLRDRYGGLLPDRFGGLNQKVGVRSREQQQFMLQDALLVQISVIRLDSATYISGIRTTSRANGDGEQVVQEAGLMIPSDVTSICLLPGSTISSIDVHFSPSGIHGLRFSFTHSTNTELVGDEHCFSNTVGMARLTAQSGIAGIIVGFDLYKAVSIQLLEQQVVNSSLIPPISAWSSSLPDTKITQLLPPLELAPQTVNQFSVHLYMPFGGEDGSRLSSLCGMTALMHGKWGFYGFLFTYSDGQEFWFGQHETLLNLGTFQSCVEQTFLVNGEAGECINSFDASRRDSGLRNGHIVQRIQVRTNFGRQYTFGALTGDVGIYEPQISPQAPSEECRITALVGRVSYPIWAFEDLKAEKIHVEQPEQQSYRMPFESISAPCITPDLVTDVGWMLQGDGSCCTIASLENLRSVHISQGAEGRSRTGGNVTGLLLDYYHGKQSAVVGQWIEEVAAFSLLEKERVVEFSLWMNTGRAIYRESADFGTVIGIGLLTSLGRSFEVRPDKAVPQQETRVRHYSTPYEYLRNITWIFNSHMDEVKISLQPTLALGDGHLCLAHSKRKFRPRDSSAGDTRIYFDFNNPRFEDPSARDEITMTYYHVRGLLFFQNVDQGGKKIPVQQVQVTVNQFNRYELVGIEFQYADLSVSTYGTKNGHSSVLHLDISRNERLSHLVVYKHLKGPMGIELHTTVNQTLTAGRRLRDVTSVATFPLELGIGAPNINVPRLPPNQVLNHGLPTLDAEQGVRGCIGIWVITRCVGSGPMQVLDFGPMYLTGPC